jgi:hypothetical protein
MRSLSIKTDLPIAHPTFSRDFTLVLFHYGAYGFSAADFWNKGD